MKAIAHAWLLTWDQYNKLKEEINIKLGKIDKEGGIIKQDFWNGKVLTVSSFDINFFFFYKN